MGAPQKRGHLGCALKDEADSSRLGPVLVRAHPGAGWKRETRASQWGHERKPEGPGQGRPQRVLKTPGRSRTSCPEGQGVLGGRGVAWDPKQGLQDPDRLPLGPGDQGTSRDPARTPWRGAGN